MKKDLTLQKIIENTTLYRKYRNKLKALSRNTEINYYNLGFKLNESDLKKSWTIVKPVIFSNIYHKEYN